MVRRILFILLLNKIISCYKILTVIGWQTISINHLKYSV